MKYFFINLLLNSFFLVPDSLLKKIYPKKSAFIRSNYLDHQSFIFLKLIDIFGYKPDTTNFDNRERLNTDFARMSLNLNRKPPNNFSYNDLGISEEGDIYLREYVPSNLKTDKAMLYFHGGGYVLGSVETHHNFVALMSIALGMKIYSLEYRLSPENKFPNALADANKAYKWLLNNDMQGSKIILCGDSAGAHLAASLSYDLASKESQMPHAQILIYPMICPSLRHESMELYKENFLLTKASMEWFWEQLRSQADDDINPRFNLLKQDRPNLMGTSTLSITAGFDPLCDEGNKYADLLTESGNEVRKLHFPDLFHGFVNLTNLRTAEKGALTIFDKIRSYL